MGKAELELDITWEDGACAITGFDSFDLHASCHCGQAFRWRRSAREGSSRRASFVANFSGFSSARMCYCFIRPWDEAVG